MLEITEVVLVYCNIVKKLLKTFDSEFSYTEVRFTDQNSKLL